MEASKTVHSKEMINVIDYLTEDYPKVDKSRGVREEYISPSRILKWCHRGAVMDSLGYPEPIGVASRLNMDYGSYRHPIIQAILMEKGVLISAEEQVFSDDPSMMGYMDGRILTPDGDEAVLEIKTTGAPIQSLDTPKSDHIDQTLLYMYMTGLDKGVILYESRLYGNGNDVPWKQFVVDRDDARLRQVLNVARYRLNCVQKRILPFPNGLCKKFCKNPACKDKMIHKKEGLRP